MTETTTTTAAPKKAKFTSNAPAKSAKKTAAKKNVEVASARGTAYAPTAKGVKVDVKTLGPQESVLFGLFQKKAPVTVADLAAAAEGKITTNQPTKRVAAYYMTQWVKNGLAK